MRQDDFLRKFRKVHGNKYDSSKVEFVKPIKVTIICPKCGEPKK